MISGTSSAVLRVSPLPGRFRRFCSCDPSRPPVSFAAGDTGPSRGNMPTGLGGRGRRGRRLGGRSVPLLLVVPGDAYPVPTTGRGAPELAALSTHEKVGASRRLALTEPRRKRSGQQGRGRVGHVGPPALVGTDDLGDLFEMPPTGREPAPETGRRPSEPSIDPSEEGRPGGRSLDVALERSAKIPSQGRQIAQDDVGDRKPRQPRVGSVPTQKRLRGGERVRAAAGFARDGVREVHREGRRRSGGRARCLAGRVASCGARGSRHGPSTPSDWREGKATAS